MTKRDAIREFIDSLPNSFPTDDRPRFREAWVDNVDYLHKIGQITNKQAQTWDGPARYTPGMRAAKISRSSR